MRPIMDIHNVSLHLFAAANRYLRFSIISYNIILIEGIYVKIHFVILVVTF